MYYTQVYHLSILWIGHTIIPIIIKYIPKNYDTNEITYFHIYIIIWYYGYL